MYRYKEKDFEITPKFRETRETRTSEKNSDKNDKKMNKALVIVGSIVGILLAVVLFMLFVIPKITENAKAEIPDVTGMSISQAENALENEGFEVEGKTKKENSDKIDKDKVISTDPEIGRMIKKGTKVVLTVSKGSAKIKIDNYKGQNYYDVKAKLENAQITVIIDKKDVPTADGVKENTILQQDVKAGEKLGKGDTITLTIPNIYTAYPDFTDGTYDVKSVEKFCEENDVTLDITYVEDASKEDGTIIYKNMATGSKVNKKDNLRIKVVKNATNDKITEEQ